MENFPRDLFIAGARINSAPLHYRLTFCLLVILQRNSTTDYWRLSLMPWRSKPHSRLHISAVVIDICQQSNKYLHARSIKPWNWFPAFVSSILFQAMFPFQNSYEASVKNAMRNVNFPPNNCSTRWGMRARNVHSRWKRNLNTGPEEKHCFYVFVVVEDSVRKKSHSLESTASFRAQFSFHEWKKNEEKLLWILFSLLSTFWVFPEKK